LRGLRSAEAFVPRWRDLQPLLIRSAGVVGIAALIMAVVSSDALRFEPEPLPVGRNSGLVDQQAASAPAITQTLTKLTSADSAAPPEIVGTSLPASVPPVPDLRREGNLTPVAEAASPLTTASVQAQADPAGLSPQIAAATKDSATSLDPLSAPAPKPVAAPAAGSSDSAWTDSAANCPRDWLAGDAEGKTGTCTPVAEMIAAIPETSQSAIEEAATDQAESLSMVPRVPLPRPDEVPEIKPVRVSRASSGSGLGPPPNCPAGQHAKWHYVDRKAGTREWYCR